MASTSPTRHAWRVLLGLLIVTAVFFGINALGVYVFKTDAGEPASSWAPELALDLQGGTQIILAASTPDGSDPTQEQLDQAASIIRQRVDASGVAEADITTEGGRNIVVQIPGPADQETRDRIQASAKLEFRAVIQATAPSNEFVGEDGKSTPNPTPAETLNAEPTTKPTDGSDPNWVTDKLSAELLAFDCSAERDGEVPEDQPMIACEEDGSAKYILGPMELDGTVINDATAGREQQSGRWTVNLSMNGKGTEVFGEISQRLNANRIAGLSPRDQFAFVLDGKVISAPVMQAAILNGKPSISGNFTQDSAKALADQLKYGALPLSFEVQSSDTISATLGSQQLQYGLIAGLIGLGLVAVYSLISYRALGWVIMASIAVMGVLTYIIIAILAWRMGIRLSLAGVAGLIVSIGFVADSFIVYFERIRDELRDGKSITASVEDGWGRAKRTIYISKSINILAATVLFILADATVKGFAFTLGLTTLIDVFIFVIFTHPVMQLLARTRFFGGGHRLSGLDPESLGAVYRGRAQYREAELGSTGRSARNRGARGEAEKRQTIAERKRAEALTPMGSKDAGKDSDA
ncbi:protein translocase subunit SecD [Microbacterium sp. NPDC058342]|uniref:protein translocase subunit SecD n=1 Tax=Microbacterium sp. NPDC058342 TaxID=3346454 RepID=UPI00365803E3